MGNPFQVVKDFESEVGKYTGAPYVVAVNSCTNALFLALKWHKDKTWYGDEMDWEPRKVCIPKRTYVSVPMQIKLAGFELSFEDLEWRGMYQLKPLPIWDAARRFTSGMYRKGDFICVSFHASKILGIEQGGAILHDNKEADTWFRRARFDGRTEGIPPKDDVFDMVGWHMYLSPSVAAQGFLKLYSLPKNNPSMVNDEYPDLSKAPIFQD